MLMRLKSYYFYLRFKVRTFFGLPVDPFSIKLYKLSKKHFKEFGDATDEYEAFYSQRAIELILDGQQKKILKGFDAEKALNNAITNLIPNELKDKLSKQDIYFWTALERRISSDFYISGQFRDFVSIGLAKDYLNNVIRIYSKKRVDKVVLNQLNNYTKTEVLIGIELQIIGTILQQIAVNKRICAKGGELICDKKGFDTPTDDNTSQALKFYDFFNKKYKTYINHFGISDLEPFPPEHGDETIKDLFIGGSTSSSQQKGFLHLGAGFSSKPVMFKTENFLLFNNNFEREFKQLFGISFTDWMRCLVEFTYGFIDGIHMHHKLYTTGYSITNYDFKKNHLATECNITDEVFEKFISLASYKETSKVHDHLLTLQHDYFMYNVDGSTVFVDGYLVDGYILNTICRVISGNTGDTYKRGKKFEKQINKRVGNLNLPQPYHPAFKFKLDGRVIAECDDSIEVNKVLVILDSKSILADHNLDLGSFKYTQNRVSEIKKKLEARNKIAEKLANQKTGDNFNITQTKVVSQLITSSNEWLPTDDPTLWWADGIPKVCRIEVFEDIVLPYLQENLPDLPKDTSRKIFII